MGIRTASPNADELEFDRIARLKGDVTCINVSPFTARIEIATQPGSAPRYVRVDPGQSTNIPHGYTIETPGAGRYPVPPAIESLTMREAWPAGRRMMDGRDNPFMSPAGPRLPMVVAEDRAATVKAQWDAALANKADVVNAPLKMTLTRNDGSRVEVDAEIVDAAPVKRAPDPDSMTVAIPDDDPDNLPPAVIPTTAPIPTGATTALKVEPRKGPR